LLVDREARCAVDEDTVDLVAWLFLGEDAEQEPRHPVRAEDGLAGGRDLASAVADHDDVGIEQVNQRRQIARGRRRGERLDHAAVLGRVGLRPAGTVADVASGTGGELADGPGRAADDVRHLVEGEAEEVVEDERSPFGWGQGLHHHQDCVADLVGEGYLVGRVGGRLIL